MIRRERGVLFCFVQRDQLTSTNVIRLERDGETIIKYKSLKIRNTLYRSWSNRITRYIE